MWRLGIESIGSDITRDYLEMAIQRCGAQVPHLVVADTENLPLRSEAVDAVLGFDAFHHIPDRRRAMLEFHRSLRPGGRVVLAEPNAEQRAWPGSKDVMEKYGILEKGMDWKDILQYVDGLPFEPPEQHFHLRVERTPLGRRLLAERLSEKSLERYACVPWNVFTIRNPRRSLTHAVSGRHTACFWENLVERADGATSRRRRSAVPAPQVRPGHLPGAIAAASSTPAPSA